MFEKYSQMHLTFFLFNDVVIVSFNRTLIHFTSFISRWQSVVVVFSPSIIRIELVPAQIQRWTVRYLKSWLISMEANRAPLSNAIYPSWACQSVSVSRSSFWKLCVFPPSECSSTRMGTGCFIWRCVTRCTRRCVHSELPVRRQCRLQRTSSKTCAHW